VDPNNPDAIGPWWENFGDAVTAELVVEALENNYDLKIAAARVEEARAILGQVHGVRWPQVSYSLDRSRAKNSFFMLGTPISSYTTVYSQGLSISYIADIFGKLKRGEQAAFADLLSTEHSQLALVHGIIAQVVFTRTQIATQQRLLNIAHENIRSRKETLQIVERRYSQGLVPPLDVHLARENLADVTSLEPRIRQALILSQHSLDVLLGRVPASSEELGETLAELPDLSPVGLSVPASLLDRRPDLRAAEMQLAAATERVGVNVAAMFPDLTFSGTWGTRADSFRGLGFTEAEVYSLVMQLMTPVFAGGRLKAGVDAAEARVEQAAANYAQVILVAMREVEDSLVEQQLLTERLEQLKVRLVEATSAEKLARSRYQRGLEKILIVIDTEQRRRLAENEIALTMGNIYNARINLYLALGGDWRPSADASEAETADAVSGDEKNSVKKEEI
jgi:multidrug efflux system outer membrane protein